MYERVKERQLRRELKRAKSIHDDLGVIDHVHDVDEDDDESMIYDEDEDSVNDSGDKYEDEDTVEEVAVSNFEESTENIGPATTTTKITTTNTTNEQIVQGHHAIRILVIYYGHRMESYDFFVGLHSRKKGRFV